MALADKLSAIAQKISAQIGKANDTATGSDTTLDGAVQTLCDGYAVPRQIADESEMDEFLTSENIGRACMFTGDTDTYTNGDIYVVEETEET